MAANDSETSLQGDVESIRYETDDREFQIIVLRHDQTLRTTVIVKGAGLLVDEHIRVSGPMKRHHSGERQLEALTIDRLLPSSKEGLIRFLSSSHIPGVGASYARRIVEHFGDQTVQILSENPRRLREVDGIGEKRAELIADAWASHEGIRN